MSIKGAKLQKPQPITQLGFCFIQCLAMTYSHMGKPHTTIGDLSFHFRVRDGIGWFQHSMVTRQNWSSRWLLSWKLEAGGLKLFLESRRLWNPNLV